MKTTRMFSLGCAILLGSLAPQPGSSQTSIPAFPGQRVRVTVSPGRTGVHSETGMFLGSGQTIVGELEGASGGTISVADPHGPGSWQIPAESVQRVEVSLGHERRMGRSVFQWTVGLAAGFGILGAMAWEPCDEVGFMACFMVPESRSEGFAWGAAGGFILGLPIGLIAGLTKHEIWRDESVQGLKASIQAAPGGGVGLGLTLPVGNRHSP